MKTTSEKQAHDWVPLSPTGPYFMVQTGGIIESSLCQEEISLPGLPCHGWEGQGALQESLKLHIHGQPAAINLPGQRPVLDAVGF